MTTIPDIVRQAMDKDKEYKPGERVPKSGIYRVTHDKDHTEHEVTAIEGKKFPPCRTCKHVGYKLIKPAVHLHDHPHYDHTK